MTRLRPKPVPQPHDYLMALLVIIVFAILLALIVTSKCDAQEPPGWTGDSLLRLRKARVIVNECYPNSGFYPWIGTLIREHERLAEKHGCPDFAGAWYWSLVYGGANFGLRVGAVAPGNCAGPMDVKHYPLILEPGANIRWHCSEACYGWRKGYTGRRMAEYVYLPSNPRDWGCGRFAQADERHRHTLERAYRTGRLP